MELTRALGDISVSAAVSSKHLQFTPKSKHCQDAFSYISKFIKYNFEKHSDTPHLKIL